MATTTNLRTGTNLARPGEAWTSGVAGERTTASFIECDSGKIEYAEAPTASAPSVGFVGHLLLAGESQNIATVAASTTIWVRARTPDALAVITPGTAA